MKIIAFLLTLLSFTFPSLAITRNWTGGGGTTNWSTAGNWSPAGTPGNGDTLHIFAASATTRNDLTNLKLDTLVIGSSTRIIGNPITLTNGIECGSGVTSEVAVDITLGAFQTFKAFHPSSGALLITGNIFLAGHSLVLRTDTSSATVNLGGSTSANVTGTGNIYVWNTAGNAVTGGEIEFSGTVGNGMDGFIQVYPGTRLRLKKTSGHPVNDLLKIGENSIVYCQFAPQFDAKAQVVIEAGGQLLGGGENHQFASLELQNSALVDSEGGVFTLRTNLIARATNATPVINGGLSFAYHVTMDVAGSASPALDIPAVISGNKGFTKVGAARVIIRGANTFDGGVGINEGVVEAQTSTAFGATSSGVTLGNGALLLRGAVIGAEPLVVTGTDYQLDGLHGSLMFGYNNSSWAGTITLNTNLVVYSGDNTTFSGSIQGTGGLDLFYDTVRLSGNAANTFTGPTWVHGVKLELNKSANTPAVSSSLIIGGVGSATSEVRWMNSYQIAVAGSVTLYTNGLAMITNFSELFGPLTFNSGRINLGTSGTLNLAGTVTVNPSPAGATIDGATSAGGLTLGLPTTCYMDFAAIFDCDLEIHSRITAGGFNKIGSGILCLYANNSYAGLNTIGAGELYIHHNGALGSATAGTVVSNGASLSYNTSISSMADRIVLNGSGAYGPNYGALYVPGTTTNQGQVSLGSSATISVGSGGHFYITSVMDGTGDLTKVGSGTLTLNGVNANTYLGQTFINSGTVQLSKGGQIAIPSNVIIGSGQSNSLNTTLRYLAGSSSAVFGNFTVNKNGLLDFNGQSESFSLPGVPLTLNLGGDVWLGGGTLTLQEGTTVIVEPGESGASTIGNPTNTGHIALFANIFANTHTFAVNAATSPSGPELTIFANLEATSGTAHVIKSGTGEMRLSGNNTYTGQLAINDGKVTLASAGAAGAAGSSVSVNSNAVLAIDGSYTFNSETLNLNGTAPVQVMIGSGGVTWNGPAGLNKNATVEIGGGGALEILGVISGAGGLTKTGLGQLYFSGTASNTYTGTTWVKEGDLLLNSTFGNGALSGPLIIGDGSGGGDADIVYVARVRQIGNSTPVTINSSGLLDIVAGKSDAFGALSGNGHILLEAGTDLEVNLDNSSSTFNGLISGSGNFWKGGTGTLTLTGNNSHTGLTIVYGGKLLVDGSQPQSAVIISNGCTLGGSGTVGNITAPNGATVSPGSSAGILTCSNVSFAVGSTFAVEFNGTLAGLGYDQLNVRGSVNISNAVLNATATPGFAPTVGDAVIIINNDGAEATLGQFSGLAGGATVTLNGLPFRIRYTGGSGNDVSLTFTNPLINIVSSAITSGNANNVIEPNECALLNIVLTNAAGDTTTNIQTTLLSETPGVIVTQPFVNYPDMPAGSRRTNTTPFQISVAPTFVCGTPVVLKLLVQTGNHGTYGVPFTLTNTNTPASPQRFDSVATVVIPKRNSINQLIAVSGVVGALARVEVSIQTLHATAGELDVYLVAPDGTRIELTTGNGGSGDNFGTGCADAARTTFSDAAATAITAGAAPFVGTFRPEGSLGSLIGKSGANVNGTWLLEFTDHTPGGPGSPIGTNNCASLFLYPATCANGGGICELCPDATINGYFGPGSPQHAGNLFATSFIGTCAAPKNCPGINPFGTREYVAHFFRNGPVGACINLTLTSPVANVFGIIYTNTFDPANLCLNYIGDTAGHASSTHPTRSASFYIAANQSFVIVLDAANGVAQGPYTLALAGGDCRPQLSITPAGAGGAMLDWTTASAGYQLEGTNNVAAGTAWPMITAAPTVNNSRYQMTNAIPGNHQFFRLRKPLP